MLLLTLLLSCERPEALRGTDSAEQEDIADSQSAPSAESCESVSSTSSLFVAPRAPELLPVLMISIDTLRRDALGRYRDDPRASPRLDAVLEQAWTLDDHRSCANWTAPSMFCVLSGREALHAGYTPLGGRNMPYPDSVPLLPDILQDAGYQTAVVTSNSLFRDTGIIYRYHQADVMKKDPVSLIAERALERLAVLRQSRSPYLLHLHLMEPHAPYDAPEVYLQDQEPGPDPRTSAEIRAAYEDWDELSPSEQAALDGNLRRRYAATVRWMDDQLGLFLDELESQGILKEHLVVFVSDHGDQHYEHGALLHHQGVYQEETGAIAALWWPGLEAAGSSSPSSHVDLLPLLLTSLGIERPEGLDGQRPEAQGLAPARRAMSLEEQVSQLSVDHQGWRLVYSADGSVELYSREDEADRFDRLESCDARARELWDLLSEERAALEASELGIQLEAPRWPE